MKNLIIILFPVISILSSCEKKEKPIKPFDRGNIATNVAEMGNNYDQHVFFKLDSNKIVKVINKLDWDIAFDCSETKHIIHPNNGRGVYVAFTGKSNFNEVTDTAGYKFNWGQPSLHIDSLAFGQWWLKNPEIFIVNLGVDQIGLPIGFVKCKPSLTSDNKLKIEWCMLNENNTQTTIIEKNSEYNFVHFSFINNKKLLIEPPKNEWDLFFTQYVKRIYSTDLKIIQNYQLAGVLINPYKITVAYDFNTPFNEISLSKLGTYKFLSDNDAIGYEWKQYSFTTNSYIVLPHFNYVISIKNGFYYKLHFVDFYNDLGVKGYPKFEFQKI